MGWVNGNPLSRITGVMQSRTERALLLGGDPAGGPTIQGVRLGEEEAE